MVFNLKHLIRKINIDNTKYVENNNSITFYKICTFKRCDYEQINIDSLDEKQMSLFLSFMKNKYLIY